MARTSGGVVRWAWRRWRTRRHRLQAAGIAPLQEHYVAVQQIGLDRLRVAGAWRAVWRVWGVDLARMAPEDQAQWTAKAEALHNACAGWTAQWRSSSRRTLQQDRLDRTARILAESGLPEELVAVGREHLEHRRREATSSFVTRTAYHLVVPGADAGELEERAELVEAALEGLRLPFRRLTLPHLAAAVAADYEVQGFEPDEALAFALRPVSLVAGDDHLTGAQRRAVLQALGEPDARAGEDGEGETYAGLAAPVETGRPLALAGD